MSKFIRKKNGDLFEVDLRPYADLYCLVKFIDLEKLHLTTLLGVALEVYDCFSATPFEQITPEQTGQRLLNLLYFVGSGHIQKHWRRVGNLPIVLSEQDLPFYKAELTEYKERYSDGFINKISWGYNDPNQNASPCEYAQVAHLEYFSISFLSVPLRIATAYYQLHGKDIREVVHLDEVDTFFANHFITITPYDKIPPALRGKPIPPEQLAEIYSVQQLKEWEKE